MDGWIYFSFKRGFTHLVMSDCEAENSKIRNTWLVLISPKISDTAESLHKTVGFLLKVKKAQIDFFFFFWPISSSSFNGVGDGANCTAVFDVFLDVAFKKESSKCQELQTESTLDYIPCLVSVEVWEGCTNVRLQCDYWNWAVSTHTFSKQTLRILKEDYEMRFDLILSFPCASPFTDVCYYWLALRYTVM